MPAKTLEYNYRHKSVSRFQVTGNVGERPFDFKDFKLRIAEGDDTLTEARNNRFLDLVGQLHPRDRMQIVEVNKEAAAAAERAIQPRVDRGAQDSSQIRGGVKNPEGISQLSQQQAEAMAEEQRKNDEEARLRQEKEQRALAEAAQIAADNAEKERLARIEADEAEQRAKTEAAKEAAAADEAAKGADSNEKPKLAPIKK